MLLMSAFKSTAASGLTQVERDAAWGPRAPAVADVDEEEVAAWGPRAPTIAEVEEGEEEDAAWGPRSPTIAEVEVEIDGVDDSADGLNK